MKKNFEIGVSIQCFWWCFAEILYSPNALIVMSNVLTDRDENNEYSISPIMPCLFRAFHRTRECSLIWDHHYRWRAANSTYAPHLCSMSKRFLYHATLTVTSVYNGHLRGPMTFTDIAEFDSGFVTTFLTD